MPGDPYAGIGSSLITRSFPASWYDRNHKCGGSSTSASAAEKGDGSVMLPFQVWRETLINDADLETAECAYKLLNPHPLKTLTDKISLKINPADMSIGKSYINGTEDISLPRQHPWHPRLSQKLGLFRLIQISGSHELCFSNPVRLARAIMDAGRD